MSRNKEKGAIMLETSIVLPIFILIIVCLLGIMGMVSARNSISHALVQSANSLAQDSYLKEHFETNYAETERTWSSLTDVILDLRTNVFNDQHFITTKLPSANVEKLRFVGYFANGSESEADEKLKNLRVVDGLNGITFSVTDESADITIDISYKLKFLIDYGGIGDIPVKQSITVKKWSATPDRHYAKNHDDDDDTDADDDSDDDTDSDT